MDNGTDGIKRDKDNTLRIDSSNTLRIDESNAIMVSKEAYDFCMRLAQEHDLEQELEKLRQEEERLQRKYRLDDDDDYFVQRPSYVSRNIPFRSPRGVYYGPGSRAHQQLGFSYIISYQAHRMQVNYGNLYKPNFTVQSCMRIFPRAGISPPSLR